MDKALAKNYLRDLEKYANSILVEKDPDYKPILCGMIAVMRFILDDKVKEDGDGSTAYI